MSVDADDTEALALTPLLGDWPSAVIARLESEPLLVRVTVASVRGSAPREPGACMLVGSRSVTGTIGGGNLEHEAIGTARALMQAPAGGDSIRIRQMTLGRDLVQCCGGVVELWFERLTHDDRPWLAAAAKSARAGNALLITHATGGTPGRAFVSVGGNERCERISLGVSERGLPMLRERLDEPTALLWLYGAGHVGRAMVRGLAELPFRVTWIDPRAELLAGAVPPNTRTFASENPAALTLHAPGAAYHLVMTHDHSLDFELCHAILTRGAFTWLGLIGSASKAAKFRARLARAGVSSERIARLVCPIGVGGLTSKLPAAIAAAVTVQLLQEVERVAERALFQTDESQLPADNARHDDCAAEDCKSCRRQQSVHR